MKSDREERGVPGLDHVEIREKLINYITRERLSLRKVAIRMGFAPCGQVVINFLHGKKKTYLTTLMRIKRFLDEADKEDS